MKFENVKTLFEKDLIFSRKHQDILVKTSRDYKKMSREK